MATPPKPPSERAAVPRATPRAQSQPSPPRSAPPRSGPQAPPKSGPPRSGPPPIPSSPTKDPSALKRLTSKLEQLDVKTLRAPAVDPRTAAIAALMVANSVADPAVRRRFTPLISEGLVDPTALDDLPVLARFVLRILPKLGIEIGERDTVAPDALLGACRVRREALLRVAERHLSEIDEAHGRIATVRLGAGSVDLVQDLRMLADLCCDYRESLSRESPGFDPAWESDARRLATELEDSLLGAHSDEEREWRQLLIRAWAMLVPVYEEVCRAGRFLFYREKPEVRFPGLAAVARVRRRIKRESARRADSIPPSSTSYRGAGHSGHSIAPEVSLLGLVPVDEFPPSDVVASAAPAPLPPAPGPTSAIDFDLIEESASDAKRVSDPSVGISLEVTYTSESTFYTGLADTASEVGLFIATFVVKPVGSKLIVELTIPESATPLHVKGTVRWVRQFSPSIETPPGMGILLQGLSPRQLELIRHFMVARPPFFYDG